MERKEAKWVEYLDVIDDLYKEELSFPLKTYFFRTPDVLIFDTDKSLNEEVKGLLVKVYNMVFDKAS